MIVDEATLNRTDRLGLAYCRLNLYEWDNILGPKPSGFDDLPDYLPTRRRRKLRRVCSGAYPMSKEDYVKPAMTAIRSIIGDANCSRCFWIFRLGKTEEEWLHWYLTKRFSDLL